MKIRVTWTETCTYEAELEVPDDFPLECTGDATLDERREDTVISAICNGDDVDFNEAFTECLERTIDTIEGL